MSSSLVWDDFVGITGGTSEPSSSSTTHPASPRNPVLDAMKHALIRIPTPPITWENSETKILTCCCLRINSRNCRVCWCIGIGARWHTCRSQWLRFANSLRVDLRPKFVEIEKFWLQKCFEISCVSELVTLARKIELVSFQLNTPSFDQLKILVDSGLCCPPTFPCVSELLRNAFAEFMSEPLENWRFKVKQLRPGFDVKVGGLGNMFVEFPSEYIGISTKVAIEREIDELKNACKFPEIDVWLTQKIFSVLSLTNPINSRTLCVNVFERFYHRLGYENLSIRLLGFLNDWVSETDSNVSFFLDESVGDVQITFDMVALMEGINVKITGEHAPVVEDMAGVYMKIFRFLSSIEFGYYCVCDSWKIIKYWQDCRALYGVWWEVIVRVRELRDKVFARVGQLRRPFTELILEEALREHMIGLNELLVDAECIREAMSLVVELRFALDRMMMFDHHHQEVVKLVETKKEIIVKFI